MKDSPGYTGSFKNSPYCPSGQTNPLLVKILLTFSLNKFTFTVLQCTTLPLDVAVPWSGPGCCPLREQPWVSGKYGIQLPVRQICDPTASPANMGSHCQSGKYGFLLPVRQTWDPTASPTNMGYHCQSGKKFRQGFYQK